MFESLGKQILELLPTSDIMRLKIYYLLLKVYSNNEEKKIEFQALY